MAENPKVSDATIQAVQDTVKGIRTILRRETDLSAQDISAIVVEPVLAALGWDTRNPKVARRPDANATLRLLSSGNTALTIRALGAADALPGQAPADMAGDGDWMVVTNGTSWALFNKQAPERAFRSASIESAASTRDAAPILAMLAQEAFKKDALAEAWMSEAVDVDIKRSLASLLDGSDALVGSLQEDLKAKGIEVSPETLRGALSRITVTIDNTPAEALAAKAAPAAEPAPEPVAETATTKAPAKTAAKAPAKPRATRGKASATKTAGATKAPAKAPAKTAAKTAAKTETAEAPVAVSAEAAVAAAPEETKVATKEETKAAAPKTPRKTAASKKRPATRKTSGRKPKLPAGATHIMQRKASIAYMSYDAETGQSIILPGSKITAKLGKAMTPIHLRNREEAEGKGQIVAKRGGIFEVVEPVSFDSPRAAATFVAATLVKDMSAWKDNDGNSLVEPAKGGSGRSAAAATEAVAETA